MRVTGGLVRGRKLMPPAITGARPTSDLVRGAIFSILGQDSVSDARVLDLFAGTGSLGIEALSREAAWADFVEMSPKQCGVIKSNLNITGLADRAEVICRKTERALESLQGPYNLVLMDPPYRMTVLAPVLQALQQGQLVEDGGIVVVGHSKRVALDSNYGRLQCKGTRKYGDSAVDVFMAGLNQ